ncbi:hypothetical protein GCK32_013836 [Trichostrongylus colubriformis]|uniref:Uncharacterized protein n=1 Tax=Trichostrongylus colubriformis TaxID=6319 RepID=A0AAN8FKW7_TRICO
MAQYEPLLDDELLQTELLKTLDHKSDLIRLKFDEFASAITARIEQFEATIVKLSSIHQSLEELSSFKPALEKLAERTTPRSACIFCTLEENEDSHPSGRCPRFPNTYARTFQVSKMGLCGQCLKPAHDAVCKVMCGVCRQPHNALLCPSKANAFIKKRKF